MILGRRLRATLTIGLAGLAVLSTTPGAAHADGMRNQQWHLKTLKVAQAQALSQGQGVTVAVIDSGVSGDHPDLEGNVLPGWDAVAGGQGDGWGDINGHGTGMAGLIAAHGHGPGNRDGALGIAPKAKILPIRVQTAAGNGTIEATGNGIEWAVAHGAKIINISLGGGGITGRAQEQVDAALKAGVIIVVSIGNAKTDLLPSFPATVPQTVAVGSVDPRGAHASISISHPAVDVVAPGLDIYSSSKINTAKDSGYRHGSGSSPSAAIVSGAAALVWAKYPQLTAAEVIERLTYTAKDLGPAGRDPQYGSGQLDLVRALTEPAVPAPNPWPFPLPSPAGTVAATTPTQPIGAGPTAGGGSLIAEPRARSGGAPGWLVAAIVGAALTIVLAIAFATARRRRHDRSSAQNG